MASIKSLTVSLDNPNVVAEKKPVKSKTSDAFKITDELAPTSKDIIKHCFERSHSDLGEHILC